MDILQVSGNVDGKAACASAELGQRSVGARRSRGAGVSGLRYRQAGLLRGTERTSAHSWLRQGRMVRQTKLELALAGSRLEHESDGPESRPQSVSGGEWPRFRFSCFPATAVQAGEQRDREAGVQVHCAFQDDCTATFVTGFHGAHAIT